MHCNEGEKPGDVSKELPFTSKQLELFKQMYENGYLYTDSDYLTWLIANHPTDIPDELLGEYNGEVDPVRSNPLQQFENDQLFCDESSKEVDSPAGESSEPIAGEDESPVLLHSLNEEESPSSSN